MNSVEKAMGEKLHVRVVQFGKSPQTIEVEPGTTVGQALERAGQRFDLATVRVGGRTVSEEAEVIDGQIITTKIPKIVVG